MKNNIRLSASIFAGIVILCCVDILIGIAGDYTMTKLPDHTSQFSKSYYRMNRLETDIIVVGSSRGLHHYVTEVIQDSVNRYTNGTYSAYNASIRGRFIDANSCTAESIMDRWSPKLLIFDVTENEFAGAAKYQDMDFLAPLYKSNRFVRQYIDSLCWEQRIKYASNMYRYNWKLPQIASSFFLHENKTGYEPLFPIMTEPLSSQNDEPITIDAYSAGNFSRVLKTAKEKNIQMIVVSSPRFGHVCENKVITAFCKEYDIPYIDMYNHVLFNEHPEYFQDPLHLNDVGAHIFTSLLFERLKPYLRGMMEPLD